MGRSAPYLCHQAISPAVLLILEDYVGVVVGYEVPEALGPPCYPPLRWPTRAKGPLGHTRHKLLVQQRHKLLAHVSPPANRSPARPAALDRQCQECQAAQRQQTGPQSHGHSGIGSKGSVLVLTSSPVNWASPRDPAPQTEKQAPRIPGALVAPNTWQPLTAYMPRGTWNLPLIDYHYRAGGSRVSAGPAGLCCLAPVLPGPP